MKIAVVSGKGGSGKSSVTAAFVALSPQVVAVDCDVDASNLPLLFAHRQLAHERFASGEEVRVDAEACVGCGLCVDKCVFRALRLNEEGVAEPVDFQCEGCGLCVRLCPQQALSIVKEENSDIYVSTFADDSHHILADDCQNILTDDSQNIVADDPQNIVTDVPQNILTDDSLDIYVDDSLDIVADENHRIMVHGRLCPGDDNSGKMIARMREMADEEMERRQISLQLLDGPPGIGCPVLSTVTGVDRVVLVCEPTLSGIADLQRIYTVASSFCSQLSVIINKCDINADNCQKILDFCQSHALPVVAELPFDKRLVDAQVHCQSIVTYAPESPCAQALKAACRSLVVNA